MDHGNVIIKGVFIFMIMDIEIKIPDLCGECIFKGIATEKAARFPKYSMTWELPYGFICLLIKQLLSSSMNHSALATIKREVERILKENPECSNKVNFESFLKAF